MTTRPGKTYPQLWTYQPDEAVLPMTVDQLRALQGALLEIDGEPGMHEFDDFHIWYKV